MPLFARLAGKDQQAVFRPMPSKRRVVLATNEDLSQAVAEGRFRQDLYYRINVINIELPALRERPEDIPVLFRHYVAQAAEQANLPEPTITPDVIAGLVAQDWPGNARALMSAAMRFVMGMHDEPSIP